MARVKKLKYTLVDGIERNTESPDTFWIPSQEDKKRLGVGDRVKLGFLDKDGAGERMWVEITEKDEDNFKGALRNTPVWLKLSFDAIVPFQSKNIIDFLIEQ